jgi:hypothetical protein
VSYGKTEYEKAERETDMAAGKLTLGYVLSQAVAEDVFMGGAMVTDAYGLPLEFRYTEPVRATKLQRILYGDVLEKYIHGDVIAGNLVSRLEQKPELFLVSDPVVLDAVQAAGRKVVQITASRVPPLKEFGAWQDISETEYFLQVSESGSPVRVRLPGYGPDASLRAEATRLLTETGRTMDLAEPAARIEAAIKMLWSDEQTPAAA